MDSNIDETKCPEGVNKEMWAMTTKMWGLMQSIKSDTEVTRDRLITVETRVDKLEETNVTHEEEFAEMKLAVNVLTSRLSRSEINQRSLKRESWKNNNHTQ